LIDERVNKVKNSNKKRERNRQVEEGVYGTIMYEAFEGLWVRVSMAFERREQGSSEGGSIESTARNLDDGSNTVSGDLGPSW
jgi:hypothetical protein